MQENYPFCTHVRMFVCHAVSEIFHYSLHTHISFCFLLLNDFSGNIYLKDTVVHTMVMNETFVVPRDSGEHTEQRHGGDATALDASFEISHRDVDATDTIQEQ